MVIRCAFLFGVLSTSFNEVIAQTKTESFEVYSETVKDSFTIKISTPDIVSTVSYATVYYLDADRTSGNDLRNLLQSRKIAQGLENVIFIGIAHKNSLQKLRSKNFIPPMLEKGKVIASSKVNRGHANSFYKFLAEELIPSIDQRYHTNKSRTLIGHSLAGLFVFYCLFKNESLFKNYIALSPALWANRFNIFNYEKQYHLSHNQLSAYLYFSTGTREIFNLILVGTRKMNNLLIRRKYSGLHFDYFEHKGKEHFSQIPVSLSYVLKHTKF